MANRKRPVDESSLLNQEGVLPNPYSTTEINVEKVRDEGSDDEADLEILNGSEPELMSKCGIVILNLSFLGINLMFLILSVEILPAQIEALVGSSSKGRVLGGLVFVGAIVTFISGPLIGMASDRLTTRYGRRRPIMVISCIVLCCGLIGMGFSAPKVNISSVNHSNSTNTTAQCHQDLQLKRCLPYYDNKTDLIHILNSRRIPIPYPSPNVKSEDDGKIDAGSLGFYIPLYIIVTISYVCTITPYNALIADKSHPLQRGLSSGVMGGMILLGNIGGASLGLLIKPLGVIGVYSITVSIMALCVAITVFFNPEKIGRVNQVPLTCKEAVFGFWQPLKDPDFRWVFITRFLMQQGLTTTVGFLEYWLGDMIMLPDCWNTYKGVSIMLIPMLISAAMSSVVSGILSDKFGRRKPLIIASSLTMAAVSVGLILLQGPYAYYISVGLAVFFGLAFGGYQAVDFALLMDVLPNNNEKSRDIAVWQQALVLPQALAVPIGGLLIDIFERVNCHIGLGYIIMFVITAIYFLLSGVFVMKIKKVR